jgi:hypothetical protein
VVGEEAIHFHELIHVIQWRLLGPEDFLAAYANGLDEFGYDNSPLEKMAYDAEALFRRSSPIFDAEKFVAEQLGRLSIVSCCPMSDFGWQADISTDGQNVCF